MKKSFFFLTVISVVFIFTNCSTPQEPIVIKNSIDETAGWEINYYTISEMKAHSGKFSSKIDSTYQYSVAYKELLKKMKAEGLTKIRFSAWVLVENVPSAVSLVGALGDGVNKPIVWVGIDVRDKIQKPNEWTKIEGEIAVPENCAENIKFGCYLFSPNKEVAYVDDFEFIVE